MPLSEPSFFVSFSRTPSPQSSPVTLWCFRLHLSTDGPRARCHRALDSPAPPRPDLLSAQRGWSRYSSFAQGASLSGLLLRFHSVALSSRSLRCISSDLAHPPFPPSPSLEGSAAPLAPAFQMGLGFSFSRVLTLFLFLCPSSSFVSGSRALPAASAFHGFTTTPLRPQRHDAGAHCDDISAGPSSSYSDAAGPSSYVIFVFTGRFALLTRQAPAALTSRQAPAAHTLMRQAPAVLSSRQAPAAQSVPRHSVVRLAWVSYMQVMVTLVSSMSDGRLLLAVG